MTFGGALERMLQRTGYSLVSEFVTPDRRMAVRVREIKTSTVVAMYHSDAIELARGGVTVDAIVHRNRAVFAPSAGVRESLSPIADPRNVASARDIVLAPDAESSR